MKNLVQFCQYLLVLFLTLSAVDTYAAHILGGHIDHRVIAKNGNMYTVSVRVQLLGDVAIFSDIDQALRIGAFVNVNDELTYSASYVAERIKVLELENLTVSCSSLAGYRLGVYEFEAIIPDDGMDYTFAYQRCCRASNLVGLDPDVKAGILLYSTMTDLGKQKMNSSPRLNKVDNRFYTVGELHELDMSFLDEDDNAFALYTANALTAGGTDGATTPGDPLSCTGVAPSPEQCTPEFDEVIYQPGFSSDKPFGPNGSLSFQGDKFEMEVNTIGNYTIAFNVEEYSNGELLSKSNYETVVLVGVPEAYDVRGNFFIDDNDNGEYDAGDRQFPLDIEVEGPYCHYSRTSDSFFRLQSETSDLSFINPNGNWQFLDGSDRFDLEGLELNVFKNQNIGLKPRNEEPSVRQSVFLQNPICNELTLLNFDLANTGTTASTFDVVFSGIRNVQIVNSNYPFELVNGEIKFTFENLPSLYGNRVLFAAQMPDESKIGQSVAFTSKVWVDNNLISTEQYESPLKCSKEKNSISVSPQDSLGFVNPNQKLTVKLEFENTGNWYVTNVKIDQLMSTKLNLNSVKIIDSSHDVELSKSEEVDPYLNFLMKDAYIPGTNVSDVEDRKGYIIYTIDQEEDLPGGTKIVHDANITFDLNDPIVTDRVTNTVRFVSSTKEEHVELRVVNPVSHTLQVINQGGFYRYEIIDLQGRILSSGSTQGDIRVDHLTEGLYFLKMANRQGQIGLAKFTKLD